MICNVNPTIHIHFNIKISKFTVCNLMQRERNFKNKLTLILGLNMGLECTTFCQYASHRRECDAVDSLRWRGFWLVSVVTFRPHLKTEPISVPESGLVVLLFLLTTCWFLCTIISFCTWVWDLRFLQVYILRESFVTGKMNLKKN